MSIDKVKKYCQKNPKKILMSGQKNSRYSLFQGAPLALQGDSELKSIVAPLCIW